MATAVAFWVCVGLICAATVAALLWPLRQRSVKRSAEARELAFYRDQLDELNRDLERELITKDQHAQAEAEIGRRILATRTTEPGGPSPKKSGVKMVALAAALVPLIALGTYYFVGSPGTPSQPFANRTDPAGAEYRALLDLAVELEQRLNADPADQDTLIALAEARGSLRQYGAAASLFGRAAMSANEDPSLQSSLLAAFAEMTIRSEDGAIGDRALAAIEESLRLNPREPRARFFLGASRLDQGDAAGAYEIWRALEAESAPNAPWLATLRSQLALLESQEGFSREDPPVAPPLDRDTMAAMMDLPPDQQAEQINAMVERLRGRLEQSPEDLDGWLRLARAYGVLQRPDEANDALGTAAKQAGDDVAALDAVLAGFISMVQPETGFPKEAGAAAGRLYSLDPTNENALWVLASSAQQAGDIAAARGFLKSLAAQLPENSPNRQHVDSLIETLSAQ